MAPDVEAEALIFDRSREATYVSRISFKNLRLIAAPRQLIAGGQTGWPSSDNDYSMRVAIGQMLFSAKDFGTPASKRQSRKRIFSRTESIWVSARSAPRLGLMHRERGIERLAEQMRITQRARYRD